VSAARRGPAQAWTKITLVSTALWVKATGWGRNEDGEWTWAAKRRLRHVAISLGAIVVARILLLRFLEFGLEEVPVEVLAFVLATSFQRWRELRPVREHIECLRTAAHGRTGSAQTALLSYLLVDLRHRVVKGFRDLQSGLGWEVEPTLFNDFMKEFAAASSASYIGTTGDLPSVFAHRYWWALREPPPSAGCMRIMIVEEDALADDLKANPVDHGFFVQWHETAGVALKRVPPETFSWLQAQYRELRINQYLTRWTSEYAVLLTPHDRSPHDLSSVSIRLILGEDDDFELLDRYLEALEARAVPYTLPAADSED
jgi:hypothetical protein